MRAGVDGGTAALIAALQPMLVATVAGRVLGERASGWMWLGMVVGLCVLALPFWLLIAPIRGLLILRGWKTLR